MDVGPASGITGWTRLPLGPVGIGLDTSFAFAAPLAGTAVAAALTSSADGLESTGGVGALGGCLAAWVCDFGSVGGALGLSALGPMGGGFDS